MLNRVYGVSVQRFDTNGLLCDWEGLLMHVQVSRETNHILDCAVGISIQRGHYFVGVEHVFEALLAESDCLPEALWSRYADVLRATATEMTRDAWRGAVPSVSGEVFHTPRCARIVNDAAKLAERFRSGPPCAAHLLWAILADALAGPSRAMDRGGRTRGELIQALQKTLTSRQAEPAKADDAVARPLATGAPQAACEAEEATKSSLESLTHDLTQAAREGKIDSVIGRGEEIFEILQILTRKTKNNAILVGEAGVGKTKVIEGLAVAAARGEIAGLLPNCRILELNLSALMSGTQYRGAFEEKAGALLAELKQSEDVILFIDEVHLVMGAGATDGSGMDFANLLKPALARGEIRCIGATTLQEYRKFVERDPAIERRFQMVRIEELSDEETRTLLDTLRVSLEQHHNLAIDTKALDAVVALTQRYMPNRNFPDKAIDVLDQACARCRLTMIARRNRDTRAGEKQEAPPQNRVTQHDIRKVVSQIAAVPLEEMTAEERQQLHFLEHRLKKQIIGQDEAVAKVVSAVKKSRAGLADPNRPDAVILFLGPTGVGKTQLAKLLADDLFGSSDHFTTFDMSEYIEAHSVSRLLGAPPGYVGSEEEGRLSAAVRRAPFSVLLFDEIEKAHPSVFDIFLPILDEGRLRDSHDREMSFRNSIIILTTNIGANLVSRSMENGNSKALMAELRNHFRPEFINRIDHIVPFYPLLFEDVRSILRIAINDLRHRLKDKQLGVRMFQRAYEHLAEQGYDPEFGARELRRTVERLVIEPISELVLNDHFKPGDMIEVRMEEDKLSFMPGQSQRKAS